MPNFKIPKRLIQWFFGSMVSLRHMAMLLFLAVSFFQGGKKYDQGAGKNFYRWSIYYEVGMSCWEHWFQILHRRRSLDFLHRRIKFSSSKENNSWELSTKHRNKGANKSIQKASGYARSSSLIFFKCFLIFPKASHDVGVHKISLFSNFDSLVKRKIPKNFVQTENVVGDCENTSPSRQLHHRSPYWSWEHKIKFIYHARYDGLLSVLEMSKPNPRWKLKFEILSYAIEYLFEICRKSCCDYASINSKRFTFIWVL